MFTNSSQARQKPQERSGQAGRVRIPPNVAERPESVNSLAANATH
jgi:hypothetical protein